MYKGMARDCPQCGTGAYRIRRRVIDRIFSLLSPLRRYRCTSIGCGWEGNLPLRASGGPEILPVAETPRGE